jgi:hypothetical protein
MSIATNSQDSTALLFSASTLNSGAAAGLPIDQNSALSTTTSPLSSLAWRSAANGWGGVEKNLSNGEQASGDGRTLTLNGTTYSSGLGAHSSSEIIYALDGKYSQFLSDVGVDDEVGNSGSVTFQVWADGSKLYDSGVMRGSSATQSIKVDLTGKQLLKLVVTDAGDGAGQDHADWAGARLVSAPPPTSPATTIASLPAGTTALSSLTWQGATNGWGGVEKNLSNGEQASGDGRTLTLNGTAYTSGVGAHSNSEITYALNGKYSQFLSDVGVDDEVGNGGSVTFQVWADGSKLYDSGVMRGSSATQSAKVDLTGKQLLKLVVTDAGDGAGQDHADWAGARLVSAVTPVTPVTPSVTPAVPQTQPTTTPGLSPAWDDSSLRNEGHPSGVPSWYSWYDAPTIDWGNNPRADWKAFTAWGQLYVEAGWNPPANSNTRVQLRNLESWYLSKSTGQWRLLQSATRLDGADFKEDFANNTSKGSNVRDESTNGGGTSVKTGNGWNYHFWTNRVPIDPTDIGGIYTKFQARLILDNPQGTDDRSSARYLASSGADYWRSVSAPWAADWSNNGGVGSGRFKFVTNSWQNFSMETLTPAQLSKNPPPIKF